MFNVTGVALKAVRRHLEAHGVEAGESGVRYGAGGEGLNV